MRRCQNSRLAQQDTRDCPSSERACSPPRRLPELCSRVLKSAAPPAKCSGRQPCACYSSPRCAPARLSCQHRDRARPRRARPRRKRSSPSRAWATSWPSPATGPARRAWGRSARCSRAATGGSRTSCRWRTRRATCGGCRRRRWRGSGGRPSTWRSSCRWRRPPRPRTTRSCSRPRSRPRRSSPSAAARRACWRARPRTGRSPRTSSPRAAARGSTTPPRSGRGRSTPP